MVKETIMKNIHILPTDDYKNVNLSIFENLLHLGDVASTAIPQHVYITSEDELNEGDIVISTFDMWRGDGHPPVLGKIKEIHEDHYLIEYLQTYKLTSSHENESKWDKGHSLKIILTTDPTLINLGIQDVPSHFLEWLVKNHSNVITPHFTALIEIRTYKSTECDCYYTKFCKSTTLDHKTHCSDGAKEKTYYEIYIPSTEELKTLQEKYDELCKEITRLHEKYFHHSHIQSPMIKLQKIEQYVDRNKETL
jgi:hypothetical protein